MAADAIIATTPSAPSRTAMRTGPGPGASAEEGEAFGRLVASAEGESSSRSVGEGVALGMVEARGEQDSAARDGEGGPGEDGPPGEPDWLDALMSDLGLAGPGPMGARAGPSDADGPMDAASGRHAAGSDTLAGTASQPIAAAGAALVHGAELPLPQVPGGELTASRGATGAVVSLAVGADALGTAVREATPPPSTSSSVQPGATGAAMGVRGTAATAPPAPQPSPSGPVADLPLTDDTAATLAAAASSKSEMAARSVDAAGTEPSAKPPAPVQAPVIASVPPLAATDSPREPVPLPRLRGEVEREVRALVARGRAEIESRRQGDGTITTEIELSPAELGRLRIVLQTGERGLHVSVFVDRPDSLEAVRRHLEGFHRSLMADGVALDDVDVGTGGQGSRAGPDERADRRAPAPHLASDPRAPLAATAAAPGGSARLDIRL